MEKRKNEVKLEDLAKEIIALEEIIDNNYGFDEREVILAERRIESIMKGLSVSEGLRLNDIILDLCENS